MIADFLADVLGYAKYTEITTEFAIRGTYCDLAIKMDEKLCFLPPPTQYSLHGEVLNAKKKQLARLITGNR
jgi:hypothetical protein